MILEAKQMQESLVEAGWDLAVTHPDLKRPGKAVSILASINDSATEIVRIDILSAEKTAIYWSQANGNHNNFPVNKITGPFSKLLEKSQLERFTRERDEAKRTDLLRKFLEESDPLDKPDSPFTQGLQSKLMDRRTQLAELRTTQASGYLDLLELVASATPDQGAILLSQIFEKLTTLSLNGDASIKKEAQKLLVTLLFLPKQKSKVPIIWNLPGKGLRGRDSSSPENFNAINTALLSQDNDDFSLPILCALTGEKTTSVGEKYPQPTFPAVGKSYLFARNKQTPSLSRYGTIGTESYEIGRSCADQLAAALSALTQPDREGKTWINIPSDKPKKSDLLLVFQAGAEDREFAKAIGGDQNVHGESAFEELSRRVLDRAKGKTTDQIRGRMLLAVLSRVDTGNRKIILNRNIDTTRLNEVAQLWTDACKSFPGRLLPVSFEKKKKSQNIGNIVISPGSIPALTRAVHFTDGRSSPDTPGGLTFSESLDLLLTISEPRKDHKRLLTITYKRLGNLLARFATIHYRQPSDIYKIKTTEKWTCLQAQSLFAVLLTSLDRPFKKTMNSLAYQLGQLCASFDILHAAYCHVERGGSLPPRLIGNACFQASSRNPISALGQLSSRAAPHLAWLNRFKGKFADRALAKIKEDSDATNSAWALLKIQSQIPDSAQKLFADLNSESTKVDDLFRSELLLGYLSGPDHQENKPAKETSSTPSNS